MKNPVALLERDLRFAPTSYGECARCCGSKELYIIIKEKISVIISVDPWLSNYGMLNIGQTKEI